MSTDAALIAHRLMSLSLAMPPPHMDASEMAAICELCSRGNASPEEAERVFAVAVEYFAKLDSFAKQRDAQSWRNERDREDKARLLSTWGEAFEAKRLLAESFVLVPHRDAVVTLLKSLGSNYEFVLWMACFAERVGSRVSGVASRRYAQ